MALMLSWRVEGAAEDTYRAQVKRLAYACRYGRAAAFALTVPSDFLQDFVEAVAEIVEEENTPRK